MLDAIRRAGLLELLAAFRREFDYVRDPDAPVVKWRVLAPALMRRGFTRDEIFASEEGLMANPAERMAAMETMIARGCSARFAFGPWAPKH